MDEEAVAELTTCICEAGAVNSECPVCKSNMSEYTGVVPGSEARATEETELPVEETKSSSNVGMVIAIVAIVVIGGAMYYYFKFVRGKKNKDEDLDFYDDESYEEEPYVNEDEEPDISEGGEDQEDEE